MFPVVLMVSTFVVAWLVEKVLDVVSGGVWTGSER